jgi:hypothetical protein
MYVIQWTLINWGMYILGFWKHDAITVTLLVPVMILITVVTLKTWLFLKKKIKASSVLVTA